VDRSAIQRLLTKAEEGRGERKEEIPLDRGAIHDNVVVRVSLVCDEVSFAPLRAAVREYVFGPLADACPVVPAALGESVVVHGALALAQTAS